MGRFNGVWRSRWAAFGAAITVALGAGSAFQAAHASDGSGAHPVFVAVTPCRLFDTRPAPENVGLRAAPLGAGDTFTAAVRGSNGNCSIPATALGVVMNVTVVNPTASSFLTVFPADAPRPLASNLNWTASSPPTPNQVTVGLSADGSIALFNNNGSVDVLADIVGYLEDHNHDDRYDTKAGVDTKIADSRAASIDLTPAQIGMLAWYRARPATFGLKAGTHPFGVAFDGTHMWISLNGADEVAKVNLDGTFANFYPVGSHPLGVAFDGTSIWVVNNNPGGAGSVTNLTLGGVQAGPFAVGANPRSVAFDGTNIWVTNNGAIPGTSPGTVTKLSPSGAVLGTFGTGGFGTSGIAFDGTNIWVTNANSGTVARLTLDGSSVVTFPVGPAAPSSTPPLPVAVAFDGTSIWVANSGTNSVTKLGIDGSRIGDYPVGSGPFAVAFDGVHIWTANSGGSDVTRLDLDGTPAGTITAGTSPEGIGFDGVNLWVANFASDNISKLRR